MVACPVSTFITSMMMTRNHRSENIGANKFFRFQNLHRRMGNISKIWPTCKIVFLLTIVISSGRIGRNQDMVNAIIAESTLDCIVSSYWLRAPYKGLLAPKYGRAENGWERHNGNERRFKSTCFQVLWLLLLVSKCNGLSCWGTCPNTSEPKSPKQFEPSATGFAQKGS